ncbi:MAG: hypothetical protein ACD_23C00732G0002 [uncultured bacterium]|nr:MAG: hypothetical protein ACD_23C00732G0002 [uncultured bacterium]
MEPFPTLSMKGPFMSVNTPILTTPSEMRALLSCADASTEAVRSATASAALV